MKHLKLFEISKYNLDLFQEIYDENPLKDTHDFYMFLGHEKFEETDGGLYKKVLDIENMVRITPDAKSVNAANMMALRAQFQHDARLYHIWLPKEIRNDVEGYGSNIDPWLVDLIDKYKRIGDKDGEGKRVMKDVIRRREDMKKYNI
jgi:hypothetical protein